MKVTLYLYTTCVVFDMYDEGSNGRFQKSSHIEFHGTESHVMAPEMRVTNF